MRWCWGLGLGVITAAVSALPLPPGSLDPTVPLSELTVETWHIRDGLPQSTIQDIEQDAQGFLWLGTQEGMARFDGLDFLVFGTETRRSLPNRFVAELELDRAGDLWIGTRNGLSRFRRGEVTTFHSDHGLAGFQVLSLLEDSQGRIVVGTARGVDRKPGGEGQPWQRVFDAPKGVSQPGVWALGEDEKGRLLLATQDRLLRESATGTEPIFAPAAEPARVWVLLRDDGVGGEGGVLLGTEEGLWRMQTGLDAGETPRLDPVPGVPAVPISAVLRDTGGALWVGTRESGLVRVVAGRGEVMGMAEGLPDKQVESLFQDRQGTLWVGTRHGLARLWVTPLRNLGREQGLEHSFMLSVVEGADGALWMGTDEGVYRRGPDGALSFYSVVDGLAPGYAWALAEGIDGAMWVGTWRGGLSRIAPDGTVSTWLPEDGLAGASVYSLLVDPDGTVWIGGERGLARMRPVAGRWILDDPQPLGTELPRHALRALVRDAQGDLWMGFQGDGVWRLGKEGFDHWTFKEGLGHNFIMSLTEADDGGMWVCTYDGLSRIQGDVVTTWGSEQGLPQETVFRALEDDRGYLWLSSNRGLFRVSLEQLEAAARGAVRLTAAMFDESEGMASRELSGGFQPAGWRARGGRLYFPTVRGLVEVDPIRVDALPMPAAVVIDAVSFEDQVLFPGDRKVLSLPRGVRELRVTFTAPTFFAPEELRFHYLLEGVNAGWNAAGETRAADFTNLPPGRHRLRVRLEEESHTEGLETNLELLVPAYFYETWMAYVLGWLLLAALIWGGYQLRLRHLVQAKRELEESVRERTAALARETEKLSLTNQQFETANERLRNANRELKAVNQDLQALHREKDDFLAVAAHDLRTPLVNIRGFSTEVRHDLRALRELLGPALGHLEEEVRSEVLTVLEREVPEALGFVESAAERVESLTNAILKLYRLGRQELSTEKVDLFEIVLGVLENLAYTVDQKGIAVDVHPLPKIEADLQGVEIITENLITNAVTYLDPGRPGRVEVGGGESEEWSFFWVRDNGIGIPDEQQEEIFRIFSRVGSLETPGEGMGLAYVDTLIKRHGGRIECRSRMGEGTRFTVYLPKTGARGDP